MDNARKYNIKVVNLSIGTNDRKVNLPLKEAVERLWQMGIVVVAAAGNPDGRNGYRPPPAVSGGVISVGAWEDRSYFLAPAFPLFSRERDTLPDLWHREMISFRCFRPILISPCPTAAVKTSWTEIISP